MGVWAQIRSVHKKYNKNVSTHIGDHGHVPGGGHPALRGTRVLGADEGDGALLHHAGHGHDGRLLRPPVILDQVAQLVVGRMSLLSCLATG